MKKRSLILFLLVIFSIGFIFTGCNKQQDGYSEFMSKYIEISKDYSGKKLTKENIENIINKDIKTFKKGNDNDLNSYTFNMNDEELIISTDFKTDELVFIRYAKLGEIELANVTKEGVDMGGYKPGFTSNLKSNNLNNQINLLNKYFSENK